MTITDDQLRKLVDTIHYKCTSCPVLDSCLQKGGSCFELLKEWLEGNA